MKKVFLEISQNSRENTCARVSFPVNFAKFVRTPFFIEHLWWVLLGVLFELVQLFKVVGLQFTSFTSLLKLNYFMGRFKLLELLHSYRFISYPII